MTNKIVHKKSRLFDMLSYEKTENKKNKKIFQKSVIFIDIKRIIYIFL